MTASAAPSSRRPSYVGRLRPTFANHVDGLLDAVVVVQAASDVVFFIVTRGLLLVAKLEDAEPLKTKDE